MASDGQIALFRQVLLLQPSSRPAHVINMLRKIRSHIEAEEWEEQKEEAKGDFLWEYQQRQRGSRWARFSKADNITIEAERRAGHPTAQFQDRRGNTITVDFVKMRDSRGMAIRAQPAPAGSSVESKSSSSSSSSTSPTIAAECAVCMSDFGGVADAFTVSGCRHRVLCAACTSMYLKQKIGDADIFPWISCPAGDCDNRLSSEDIFAGLDGGDATSAEAITSAKKLAATYLQKWIVRYPEWTECNATDCNFGFMVSNQTEGKKLRCGVCNKRQTVKRKSEEQDEGLKKMIADGTLRPCPKCKLLTMKEYGVCNVISCQQCSVVWHWRTRETARTSKELKLKARRSGTLWEPGELAYQQTLQRTNKAEFIKLLERNGVRYDPNYRRGQ